MPVLFDTDQWSSWVKTSGTSFVINSNGTNWTIAVGDLIMFVFAYDNLTSTTPVISGNPTVAGYNSVPHTISWSKTEFNSAQSAGAGAAKMTVIIGRITALGDTNQVAQLSASLSAAVVARAATAVHITGADSSWTPTVGPGSTSVGPVSGKTVPTDGAFILFCVSEQDTLIQWSGTSPPPQSTNGRGIATTGGGSASNVSANIIGWTHFGQGSPITYQLAISDGQYWGIDFFPASTAGSATFSGATGTATANSQTNGLAMTGDANKVHNTGTATASGGTGALVRSINATLTLNTGTATAAGLVGALSNVSPATFSLLVGQATAASAAGGTALRVPNTFSINTNGTAIAAGLVGGFTSPATFTTVRATATASGVAGQLMGGATFAGLVGGASAVGLQAIFKVDKTLTLLTGSAAASGGQVALSGGANSTFSILAGQANAAGNQVQLRSDATFTGNTGAASAAGLAGKLAVSVAFITNAAAALAAGMPGQLLGTVSATFAVLSANAQAEGNNAFLRSATEIPMLVGLEQVKGLAVGSTLSPRGYLGAVRLYGPPP